MKLLNKYVCEDEKKLLEIFDGKKSKRKGSYWRGNVIKKKIYQRRNYFYVEYVLNEEKEINKLRVCFEFYSDSFKKNTLEKICDNLTNLNTLIIWNEKIKYLPDNFGNLINLEKLNLAQNEISYLPDSFCNLINLKDFRMDENKLTALPNNFVQLINLKKIKLDENLLSYLPENIASLTNLKELGLNHNNLTFLPYNIGNLKKLEKLFLCCNNFVSLPQSIGELTNLEKLVIESFKVSFFNRKTAQEIVEMYQDWTPEVIVYKIKHNVKIDDFDKQPTLLGSCFNDVLDVLDEENIHNEAREDFEQYIEEKYTIEVEDGLKVML